MALLPFIVHLPVIFALSFLLYQKSQAYSLKKYYWPGLFFKLTLGISLGLIYFYHYKFGDTLFYQNYSNILTDYLIDDKNRFISILFYNEYDEFIQSQIDFWDEPRAMLLVKFISIINLFTFKNYWINSLYFSFFSFWGLWLCANKIRGTFKISDTSVAFAFLFLPSFVFWSSGLIKDSLMAGIIALSVYYYLVLTEQNFKSLKTLSILLILIFIGWKIKFYYAALLAGLMLSLTITKLLQSKYRKFNVPAGVLLIPTLFSLTYLIASRVITSLNTSYILFIMHHSYEVIVKRSGDFSFINLTPEVTSYLFYFPKALFTGLFRPLSFEKINFLPLMLSIENLFLATLFAGKVYSFFKLKNYRIDLEGYTLFLYITLAAALMAFIAPNWGTLSRYKAGYLMFWALLLCENNLFFDYLIHKIKSLLKSMELHKLTN